ncbi:unnamed protein product [Rotaria magnacalcarata]|uniref:Uncharacterized protein n=1 Tax=Rotaria magnacalcarata TaxID=392030 RepID=A0A816UJE3_9BILA|nr:unnamed protein product [Rotaria magnacalcarata]CAF3741755.1 unnamed protein product [Rotaria magnacalcarata]
MFALRLSTVFRRTPFSLIHRSSFLSTHIPIQQIRPPQTTRLDLDQLLERLDGEAHRRGRLNPGLVRGAMRKAAVELDAINSTQALLLIRCTGSLLISELPHQRQQVLDHMMKIFKQKHVTLDVTHYNSYMRVSLQNNHLFDPINILDDMRKISITPNLTSFRLFIECYARQGRSDDIQKILNEMKIANLNIEPLVLTHLLSSYALKGNVERVESLFNLFHELELKPISETYEQFIVSYLKHEQIDQATKYFVENVSKMDNESLFRLIIKCAECQQKDLFQLVINSLDQNSLADICIQYILCATELLDAKLDDYAFLLIDSFPKRDETLRFDVINLTMLNLLKIRLPTHHFRPFSALTLDDINNNLESSINYQCESESVSEEQLNNFRRYVLKRAESFTEKKDRWLSIHQLLYQAYQNYIPLPYIYSIYDTMHEQGFEYRQHYMRPLLVKLRRMYINNPKEMVNQTRELLDYLQKKFSINYDNETIDYLVEFFYDESHLKPSDIDILFKKVNIPCSNYWLNLYSLTLKRINMDLLDSLKVFLNINKNVRFEYTPVIREQTLQAMQSLINQLYTDNENKDYNEIFNHLKSIIDFIDTINKRFIKNQNDIISLNDCVLIFIVNWFLEKEHRQSVDLLKKILKIFEQRSQTIPLTNGVREKVYKELGIESSDEVNDRLVKSLKQDQQKSLSIPTLCSSDNQSLVDDSSDIYIKSTKSTRNWTIRELEDHLIELQRKKMNTSGITSKLLTKYCTECLDSERTMTTPVRELYVKRISNLESIYFDKTKTTGFPSLGVIAILVDYYSRVELNLDKVVHYISLSNQIDPKFKLDPHKCVSVIRLLIRKNAFNKAIELIDSLGGYDIVPNYMYRRVRDLLLDSYSFNNFEQFQSLVNKLLKNKYVDPSSAVLSLIVRKSYQDNGPLPAFETIKHILVQWNNLVGMFPIIRKLLRDDCTEELKQVLIRVGKFRSRTYAYEQLAFALIHEHRLSEAYNVCQNISRSTFEEHCQKYVRELFYFPSDNQNNDDESTPMNYSSTNDIYETDHVFDTNTISLIYFIDYIEQYPSCTRQLSKDVLFYSLFRAYEKTNRLDEFTKLIRDYSSKYARHLSSKTKDAFSQAGITLSIKSLSSPKQSRKNSHKRESFLDDHDYEEDSNSHQSPF